MGVSESRRSGGLAIVVLVQFAALTAVCLLIGDNGWDDGAITLAFSRTFAQDGLIALTRHSEVVEGFSSVSWFLLNAVAALAKQGYRPAGRFRWFEIKDGAYRDMLVFDVTRDEWLAARETWRASRARG